MNIENDNDNENSLNSTSLSIIISSDNNNNSNNNNTDDNEELIISKEVDISLADEEITKDGEQQPINIKKKVPLFAYVILFFALMAMSSSGSALKSIEAPPLLKASWRLQSTSILLLFGLIYEIITIYNYHIVIVKSLPLWIITKSPKQIQLIYNNNSNEDFIKLNETTNGEEIEENENENIVENENSSINKNKEEIKIKLFQKNTILLLIGTGIILGLHFSFWVTSLDKTTLSHSLLFVTSSPIMIVLVMLVRRLPISKGEIFGCVLGFIGLIITLFDSLFLGENEDAGSNSGISGSVEQVINGQTPTLLGDFLALMGAVCIVFYLFAGAHLRKWMPLFCYAFPVTFIASIFCSIASLIIERSEISIVGWLSPSFILLTLYLAVGPGLIGHTGMNKVILYIEPVVISVVLLLEPPIGSLMGYIVGVSELPTFWTYIGGPFIIGGCVLVSISSHLKNKNK